MTGTAAHHIAADSSDAVFVGRQAIFDRALEVVGYELLYRNSEDNQATFSDGNEATGQVLLNTFVEIGIEQIAGSQPVFVNVNDSFVLDGHCRALPKDQVVLELLEDAEPSDDLVRELSWLSRQGYRIALDDFVYDARLDELIRLAEIVKIDVRQLNRRQIDEHVRRLQRFDVTLLAEKVETHDDFEFCDELGFTYFQGYFASRPRVISGRRIPADRLATMQLLAKLHDPQVQLSQLEELIKRDPGLCYKLLRFINSSACGLRNQVNSIRQAAALVGIRKLRTWASLLGFGSFKNKPSELVVTANLRAKMCEQLAIGDRLPDPDQYFTVGLFSLLDAFADHPMRDVLKLVPLADEIAEALTDFAGPQGEILRCVLAYEAGDWDVLAASRWDSAALVTAYVDALNSTIRTMEDLRCSED